MDIKRFNEYLNEAVSLPILDVVIDGDGNVYNGIDFPLVKGRVERKRGVIRRILGTDNIEYPCGLEKNGNLVGIDVEPETWYILSNGNRIVIPDEIRDEYNIDETHWRIRTTDDDNDNLIDYFNLLPTTPTGWVNVKIDMEFYHKFSYGFN